MSEQNRLLEKRAQVFSDQDNIYSGRHRRGPSSYGTRWRYEKRQKRKWLLEAEAERKRRSDACLEEVETLLQQSAAYPWMFSDTWVQQRVEELRKMAKDILTGEVSETTWKSATRSAYGFGGPVHTRILYDTEA